MRAWIEVDLSAIRYNFQQIRNLVDSETLVIPVVKANAYGHGSVEVAKALAEEGAEQFAVTFVDEAAELRSTGVSQDILLLSTVRGEDTAIAVQMGLSVCVMDLEGISEIAEESAKQGKVTSVHLKIDTGMGRLGVKIDGAVPMAEAIAGSDSLKLAGVYSHCASGSSEPSVSRQLKVFQQAIAAIEAAEIPVPLRHIAASGATLSLTDSRLDAVRIGNLIYGQYPSGDLKTAFQPTLQLKDTWTFKTRITAIRTLGPGSSVGYGSEYQTGRLSRIAIVPVGMADGLSMEPMSLKRRGLKGFAQLIARGRFDIWATVREEKAPVVGRVAMQLTSIDVTDIPGVSVGDEVILPVRRLAAGQNIPRVYLQGE